MTDRERMIEVIDKWQTEVTGCQQSPEYAERLADSLIEAGFEMANVSFKKFQEDVLYHGFHERWDEVRKLVKDKLE